MNRFLFVSMAALTAALLLLAACGRGFDDVAGPQLVVEGWIDSGRFPVVMVSRTVPITDDYQSTDNLAASVERWARVTVSDGERVAVLVGMADEGYFPPYVYTTSDLRGVPGRTYRLTVDCPDGTHAEAVTTIPEPAAIDSLAFVPAPEADTLRQLYAYVGGGRAGADRYRVFTQVLGSPYGYRPAYLGLATGEMLPANGRMPVNRGRLNMEHDFTPYFAVGDTVMVKLARIDGDAYRFWRGYEDMMELSRNPLFPVTANLHSNVSGALGYWFGYGSAFGSVVISR